jgi:hypothetical protein
MHALLLQAVLVELQTRRSACAKPTSDAIMAGRVPQPDSYAPGYGPNHFGCVESRPNASLMPADFKKDQLLLSNLEKEEEDLKRSVRRLEKRVAEALLWDPELHDMRTFVRVLLGLEAKQCLQGDGYASVWGTFNFSWLLRLLSGKKPAEHRQALLDVCMLLWVHSAGTYSLLRSYIRVLPGVSTLEVKKGSCDIAPGINLTSLKGVVVVIGCAGGYSTSDNNMLSNCGNLQVT